MIKGLLIPVILFLSLPVLADGSAPTPTPNPAPDCTAVRTAKATVRIYRLHWQQDGANWKPASELISTSNGDINVLGGPATGCKYSNITRNEIILDGESHYISINALIYQNLDGHQTPRKWFTASYNIDRNKGEFGAASAFSYDLSLKNIGVMLQTPRTAPSAGGAFNDSVNVSVEFEDSNAK